MLVERKENLKACIQNKVPCRHLLGYLEMRPLLVMCLIGKKCGRNYCRFYEGPQVRKKSKTVGSTGTKVWAERKRTLPKRVKKTEEPVPPDGSNLSGSTAI